jgi:hypothetical protein
VRCNPAAETHATQGLLERLHNVETASEQQTAALQHTIMLHRSAMRPATDCMLTMQQGTSLDMLLM